MPYVKADDFRQMQQAIIGLQDDLQRVHKENVRNREALVGKYRVELEALGVGTVLWHFFEKPGERWTVRSSIEADSRGRAP